MLRSVQLFALVLVLCSSSVSQAQLNEWINIHPGGPDTALGGPILWVKYGTGTDAYMMSRNENFYRRQDSASAWELVNPTLDGSYVLIQNLFFDSSNPDRLIANRGTGPFPNFGGVLESTDGGDTWTTIRDGAVFSSTMLSSQNANNLDEIIAYMPVYHINETPKLAKSFDGGVTWTETEMQKDVAGPHKISTADSNVIYGMNYSEFNKSIDGGVTWELKDQGLGNLWYFDSFDSSDSNPDIVYGGSGAGTVIFKSVDGAETWQSTASVPQPTGTVTALKVDPTDPDVVFAGTNFGGTYFTETGGQSWGLLNSSQQYGRWLDIELSLSGEVMWGGYSGVHVRNTNGELIPSNTGFSEFPMYQVKFAPSDSSFLYASSHEGGFVAKQEGVTDWSLRNGSRLVFGSVPENFSIDPNNSQRIVAAGNPSQITTDGGLNWSVFAGPDQPLTAGVWIDPADPQRLIAKGSLGLSETSDQGANWTVINADANYQEMWMNQSDSSKWFARNWGLGHLHSQDGGETWAVLEELANGSFGPTDLTEVAQDYFDHNTLYLISQPFGSFSDGVIWRSTDFGASWQTYGAGSSNVILPVALSADPFVEGRVYVLNFSGSIRVYEPSEGTWLDLGVVTFNQCGFGACSIIPDPDQQGRVLVQFTGILHEINRDSDSDGVADSIDNCTFVPNSDQRDSNGDSFGSACDADINNDNIVNFIDVSLFAAQFLTSDSDSDFNGDGAVNFLDFPVLQQSFLKKPGPNSSGDQ